MFYGVVEFSLNKASSKELAVVPLIWLFKNDRRCYWPNRCDKTPLSSIVKACMPPGKSWRHHSVFRVHLKTNDYNMAEKEVDQLIAEYESQNNLSTGSTRSLERKHVVQSDTSDSDEEDELILKPVPAKIQKTCETQNTASTAKENLEIEPAGPSVPFLNYLNLEAVQQGESFHLPQTPSASSTSTLTNLATENNDGIFEAVNNPIIIDNGTRFNETILTALAKLQTTNDQILLTMQEILRYNKKITLEKMIAPENLPPFPLKTYEDYLNFEHLAKEDPIVNQYMIRRLAALGGSGIEGVTRRIMKYLMANQLGIQFNWKGRHNKVAFENTATMNIVLEAAKLNFPVNEKNDLQVAWAVKEWLKHSAARLNASRNK